MRKLSAPLLAAVLLLVSSATQASDQKEFTLSLRNHKFVPAQLVVPANTKFKLIVVNLDPTPEEFESHELNREKIVTGKGKITVLLGIIPLRISAYWVVGLFVLTQLWNLGASSKSEVAYWCHFGGMVAGGVLFPLIKPRWVKLFQCRQRVPDTVVQIGPNPVARAARLDNFR